MNNIAGALYRVIKIKIKLINYIMIIISDSKLRVASLNEQSSLFWHCASLYVFFVIILCTLTDRYCLCFLQRHLILPTIAYLRVLRLYA